MGPDWRGRAVASIAPGVFLAGWRWRAIWAAPSFRIKSPIGGAEIANRQSVGPRWGPWGSSARRQLPLVSGATDAPDPPPRAQMPSALGLSFVGGFIWPPPRGGVGGRPLPPKPAATAAWPARRRTLGAGHLPRAVCRLGGGWGCPARPPRGGLRINATKVDVGPLLAPWWGSRWLFLGPRRGRAHVWQ